jgi:hypothetical protein
VTHDADDRFLARWSKRKHAVRRGETPPEPAQGEAQPAEGEMPAPAVPPAAAPPELPPIDSLKGLESDYQDFLRPDVDPATKSAALRKLFGDPHFNRMDGMDVYIDDYTKEDPIPSAMLRALNQARSLGLFDDEGKKRDAQVEPAAEPAPAAIEEARPAPPEPAPVAQAAPQPATPEKPDPA